MRKNKLFKKAIAVIAAACTFVSATGFNGTTVKAADFSTISVNQEVSGEIIKIDNESSVNYYTFVTDETDAYYRLNVKAYDGGGFFNYWIYSDAEMTEIVKEGWVQGGKYEIIDLAKDINSLTQYYIRVSGDSIKYKFSVEKYSIDDFGDNRTDLKEFAVGEVQKGVINHHTDVDYFTFKTDETNAFYYLDTKATWNAEGYAYITYEIYSDAEMTDRVFEHYIETGETIKFDLAKKLNPSKQYYVKVSGSTGMEQANYQLAIIKVSDDVQDTVDKAKKIELNNSYKQTIENKEDVDCFKITTSNYTDYKITLKGTSANGWINYYIYKDKDMTLLAKEGYISGKDTISKQDSAVKLTPYKTYYIKIAGAENSKYTIGINAAAPANNKAKAQTVKKTRQVTISWSKVNKATGYEVYRAVKNGSYKKVATIKSAKTVKWIDKKVKKGYTYKYKVRAYAKVKGKTYYSAYSAEKAVKVK